MPDFLEIWLINFEMQVQAVADGNSPIPSAFEAWELGSDRFIRLSDDELNNLGRVPVPFSDTALVVVYDASKQVAGFLAQGWPIPPNIVDLFIEFRCLTNGRRVPCGNDLSGSLVYFGLDAFNVRNPVLNKPSTLDGSAAACNRREPFVPKIAVESANTHALKQLFHVMKPHIDWPRALLRGRYGSAVAVMERNGIPIDIALFERLSRSWLKIQMGLVEEVDSKYGVYDGITFKVGRFRAYLKAQDIDWPLLPSGQFDLSDETFKFMSHKYPQLASLRELRRSLSLMRLSSLTVGRDGRNRCPLSMFASRTGRNQPSSNRFVFGLSAWLRSLIRPRPGQGLAYVDFLQQEFGIAAALSGDTEMMGAYESGDPYVAFAKQAGVVPPWGSKATHPTERDQFKATVLAVQYGMGVESLAFRIGKSRVHAQALLDLHRETYKKFWVWSDAVLNEALLGRRLWTTFGWQIHIGDNPNDRSLRNFPMQANGAEILRLTCIQLLADGVKICAPIHDAVLIEAPLSELDAIVKHTQKVMRTASAAVLSGFCLDSDAKLVRYPDRYVDDRGTRMWNAVMRQIDVDNPAVLVH